MFSYMYDLNIVNKYDISCASTMGQSVSGCGGSVAGQLSGNGGSSSRCSSRRGSRDLKRSKSVHLMELVQERRPKSHRFWRERRVVGDVLNGAGRFPGEVRLIDLEAAALSHTNSSAWCLSFDADPDLDSVRIIIPVLRNRF